MFGVFAADKVLILFLIQVGPSLSLSDLVHLGDLAILLLGRGGKCPPAPAHKAGLQMHQTAQ